MTADNDNVIYIAKRKVRKDFESFRHEEIICKWALVTPAILATQEAKIRKITI
jgi:hypothetical protein